MPATDPTRRRVLALLPAAAAAAACTTDIAPDVARQPLGDFRLDRVVVVIDEPVVPPYSRSLPPERVKAEVAQALERRFGRFDGAASYSIGVKVHGYVLSGPAVPVLLAPRSQLFLSANVYDARPARLNPEPRNLTVNEDAGGDTVIGSGYTQTADEQIAELAENAAVEIERWLRENPGWFGPAAAALPAG